VRVLDLPSRLIPDDALAELPSVAYARLRGEEDDAALSLIANDDLACRDMLYLWSVMLHPHDCASRTAINHAMTADELYHAVRAAPALAPYAKISVKGDAALAIADREDWQTLLEAGFHNDRIGHIAVGYMLRWCVSCWERPEHRAMASLAKAASIVGEWLGVHKIKGGSQQNIIRNWWGEYKSVAHLWAAFHLLHEWGRPIDGQIVYNLILLGTAQWLAERGAQIVPKGRGAGEAILPAAEIWQIPPEMVPRCNDGTPAYRIWNTDHRAHDLRDFAMPPALQPM
jgi:hypothetical protein